MSESGEMLLDQEVQLTFRDKKITADSAIIRSHEANKLRLSGSVRVISDGEAKEATEIRCQSLELDLKSGRFQLVD